MYRPTKPQTGYRRWNTFTPYNRHFFPRLSSLPLKRSTLLIVAAVLSLFATLILSFAIPPTSNTQPFLDTLGDLINGTNGVALVARNIDVDVEEPQVTFTWSLLGCGQDFVLSNITGPDTGSDCGLLSRSVKVFIDGLDEEELEYDPAKLTISRTTNQWSRIINMIQFDSDHTLNVDKYLFYPFDTYSAASSIRIVEVAQNATLPIVQLSLRKASSANNFQVAWQQADSFSIYPNDTMSVSRDVFVQLTRPARAIVQTMLYFALSWTLVHLCIFFQLLSIKDKSLEGSFRSLVVALVGFFVVPYCRNAMPDAPDTDGVIIDNLGYFPQMIILGGCIVVTLIILVLRITEEDPLLPSTRTRRVPRSLVLSPTSPTVV